MNRNELNRKLNQLNKDYNKSMQEIDRKSRERETKKLNELYDNAIENMQKPSKTEQNETIPEEKTEEQKELRELYKQWKIYNTSFPSQKNIWIMNFPKWFVELMESE